MSAIDAEKVIEWMKEGNVGFTAEEFNAQVNAGRFSLSVSEGEANEPNWETRMNEGWHAAGEETKKNEALQAENERLRAAITEALRLLDWPMPMAKAYALKALKDALEGSTSETAKQTCTVCKGTKVDPFDWSECRPCAGTEVDSEGTSETAVQPTLSHNELFQLRYLVQQYGDSAIIGLIRSGIKDGREGS